MNPHGTAVAPLYQTAAVRRAADGWLDLQIEAGAGCEVCGSVCGPGQWVRWLRRRQPPLKARNACRARPGDRVRVAVAPTAVWQGAVLCYGLPLAGLLGGAAAGQAGFGEPGAAFGAIAGALAGWWWARRLAPRTAGWPEAVAIIDAPAEQIPPRPF